MGGASPRFRAGGGAIGGGGSTRGLALGASLTLSRGELDLMEGARPKMPRQTKGQRKKSLASPYAGLHRRRFFYSFVVPDDKTALDTCVVAFDSCGFPGSRADGGLAGGIGSLRMRSGDLRAVGVQKAPK